MGARRPRVVLFDIDQTLVRTGGAGRRALERAVEEVAGVPASLARVPFAGRTDPSILSDLLAAHGVEERPGLAEAIFARYVVLLEREVAGAARGGAAALLPGVRGVLERLLAAEHVAVGLLTGNIAAGARLKLGPLGIADLFRFGAYGDDHRERPALLPIALERWRRLSATPVPCAMQDVHVVGDTVHDVAVAKAWGARSVAVGTGAGMQPREALLGAGPDRFFEDLTAADPWVDEVLGHA